MERFIFSNYVTTYPTGLPLCADWKSAFADARHSAPGKADFPIGTRRQAAGQVITLHL
jgi:hypothetical protein